MNDEMEMKIKFLGKSRALRAWDSRYKKGWVSDEEYADAVERLYRVRMKTLGLEPDGELPVWYIPEDFGDPESGVLVGNPVHEELEMHNLYLPIEELTGCHVGLWGKTRWGKTYQMAHILKEVSQREPQRTFIAYDTQNELAGILANLLSKEKLLHIPLKDYWKNPIQEVYEHGLEKAVGNLKRTFLEATYIGAPTVNLLEQIIRGRCTNEKLVALGPPLFKDILNDARHLAEEAKKGRGSWKNIEYLHSLMNILDNLSLSLSPAYNRPISKGFSFSDFEGMAVVIDISEIKDPMAMKFFVTKELLDLSLYAEGKHAPATILLDETHRFAPLEKQWGAFTSPALVDGVKTMLKRDINYWMAEQNPGQFVNPAILANVGTHFAFRLPSVKDRWPVLYSINVSEREQAEKVGALEKMHCLIYGDSLGAAVLMKTRELDIKDMSKEASRRSAALIKAFHDRFMQERAACRKKGPHKPKTDGEQGPQTVQEITKKRIAEHRAKSPLSGITETYQEVGVSPEIGRKHLKEMLEIGWLEGPGRMPLQGSGHKSKDCYAVTEKGCKSLSLDWEKARLPGKGSLISRLAARMIGLNLEKKERVVRYEYSLSSGEVTKAADVAVLEDDGAVMAYEYQSGIGHLIENIERNAEAGFKRTIVVCHNQRGQNLAKKEAKKKLEEGLLKNVEFATLKEFA